MKTYTPEYRDQPRTAIDLIRDARKQGRLADAQRLLQQEIMRNGGKVSSTLADQQALIFMAAEKWGEARDIFLLIVSNPIFGDQSGVWRNIAQCSEIIGDYEVARHAYLKSIKAHGMRRQADEARPYFGYGSCLFRLGEPELGEKFWRTGLTKRCDTHDAIYQRSQVKLAFGMYEEGWEDYESRKELVGYQRGVDARTKGYVLPPAWNGGARQKGIVICVAGQGAGDVIQFSRYLPMVEARTEFRPHLMAGEPLREFLGYPEAGGMMSAHLDSLPFLLGHHEPIPPQGVARPWARLRTNPKPRIGVCWKGSPKHLNDKDRSCPFDFRPVLRSEQWELVSLQEGHDFHPKDYQETAEVMRGLDAVLTVDTSVVHVAGTLGVPTILIPPASPEWRWGVHGDTTPWYPSVTIVRRKKVHDWPEVLGRAYKKLEEVLWNPPNH